ncbi:enoyl-CoA hydratase/isomerase family protein [Streptomyces sp. NPDC051940]|uniref:enoyl-CoA hydratase/isomerase family protein n=1 Tax=Streptomyces sp. NPDC051940 TaxID=3155675 RepID=UPI003421F76F
MSVTTRTEDGVAVVTLDRPHRHNALDLATADALRTLWRTLRLDDGVRAIVLTGAGDRAFCTGLDRDAVVPQPSSPYSVDDPLLDVGPKSQDLWKPVVGAVNGMACGGAFYLLTECDFLIADENATFFDPHTTYGMVNAYEAIALTLRMPPGEAARLALMGSAERIGARRAYETGLVSEVVPPGRTVEAAVRAATVIAGSPTTAVQGTVRALWTAKLAARQQAFAQADALISLGSAAPGDQAELFARRAGEYRVR